MGEHAAAVMGLKVLVTNQQPILRPPKVTLLAKPGKIPSPIRRVSPVMRRHAGKEQSPPRILRQVVFDRLDGRAVIELEKRNAGVGVELVLGDLVPILKIRVAELLAQPGHIATPVLAFLPEAVRYAAEEPFRPRVLRQRGHDGVGRRAVVSEQKRSTLVLLNVVAGETIPVFGPLDAELTRQPIDVAAVVLRVLPEAERCLAEQPLVPFVVLEALFDSGRRRARPVAGEDAAAAIAVEVAGGDFVPVIEGLVAETLPKPVHVAFTVAWILPIAPRDWAVEPNRVELGHTRGGPVFPFPRLWHEKLVARFD
jgi:hypothetical protein